MASLMDDDEAQGVMVMQASEIMASAAAAGVTEENGQDAMVPDFPPLTAAEQGLGSKEYRRIRCPPHRLTPLRADWNMIMQPCVEHLMLQIRYNPKMRAVELKTSEHTADAGSIQKGADFVQAYMLGFEVQDAVALLRLEDLFVDTFEVKDVKTLSGDHLSRAIGRIAGQDGKTRFAIENATRTRIVLADSRIHILGSFQVNITLLRNMVLQRALAYSATMLLYVLEHCVGPECGVRLDSRRAARQGLQQNAHRFQATH